MSPRRLPLALVLAAALALPGGAALAQPARPQAHETSIDGVTAEIVEARRKDGVLTMKVRYRNTGESAAKLLVYRDWNDGEYYVTAGATKLMVLKDSKGVPVAVPHSAHGETHTEIKPNGSYLYWAKYPAPPAEAKKVTFYHPHSAPIEDIPVMDGP